MELSELSAYAAEKYHIREQHKWADLPAFSVLADPDTGKGLALLMRQWDGETGTEIQRCDLKCGREILKERPAPYLSLPFRMKGENWVGIRPERCGEPEVVFRLFDRAVEMERQRGAAIVLENKRPGMPGAYRDTPLPFAGGIRRGVLGTASGSNEAWKHAGNEHVKPARPVLLPRQEPPTPARPVLPPRQESVIPVMPEIPERIRSMMRLYEYRGESFDAKCRNFLRQGKFMEDYEDDEPWEGEYRFFFPTYHDLNLRQLRGYFTWRTRIRKGIFQPVSSSLAYIYLYELLNGIGAADPEDSLRKMQAFEKGYLDSGVGDPGIRRNLQRWMLDYAVLHGLPPETVRRYVMPFWEERDRALVILKTPQDHTDEEIAAALLSLSGKRLQQSPVIGREDGKGEAFLAALWRYASEHFSDHLSEHFFQDGMDLFTACFSKPRRFTWHPLANAVCIPPDTQDTEYVWSPCRRWICRGGVWLEERYEALFFNNDRLQALLREADRQFRRYLKTGHYLREKAEEAWAAPFAEAVIAADREAQAEAARPRITLDLTGLDKIRQDALITRDNLLAGEESGEDILLAVESDMAVEESSTAAAEIDTAVGESSKEVGEIDTSAGESSMVFGEDSMAAGVGATPAEKQPSEDEGENQDSFVIIDPLHLQILRKLLRGESAEELMRTHFLMPSVVADTINEALFDEIGDNVLECDGESIVVVEDYWEDIKEIVGV